MEAQTEREWWRHGPASNPLLVPDSVKINYDPQPSAEDLARYEAREYRMAGAHKPLHPLLIQANACALKGYTGFAEALVKLHAKETKGN